MAELDTATASAPKASALTKSDGTLKDSKLWLPPSSAILQLGKNVQCLIDYYLCSGHHYYKLPNFLTKGCLRKTNSGEKEFYLGEEAKIDDFDTFLKVDKETLLKKMKEYKIRRKSNKIKHEHTEPTKRNRTEKVKRKITETPQKGERRKLKPMASTPKGK